MKTRVTLISIGMLSLFSRFMDSGAAGDAPGSPASAAQAVNALGLELLAKGTAPNVNALLSPYSIQTALAMTYAGS